jgi:hypothetical protein
MTEHDSPAGRSSILDGTRIIEILLLVAILTALFHGQIRALLSGG